MQPFLDSHPNAAKSKQYSFCKSEPRDTLDLRHALQIYCGLPSHIEAEVS